MRRGAAGSSTNPALLPAQHRLRQPVSKKLRMHAVLSLQDSVPSSQCLTRRHLNCIQQALLNLERHTVATFAALALPFPLALLWLPPDCSPPARMRCGLLACHLGSSSV